MTKIRRVCFAYTASPARNPGQALAGFRAEESPMLWVMSRQGDSEPFPRTPGVGADDDPLWSFSGPRHRWCGLATAATTTAEHPDLRLAWTPPDAGNPAQMSVGSRRGATWSWQTIAEPGFAEDYALQSLRYFHDMAEPTAYRRLLDELGRALEYHGVGGAGSGTSPIVVPTTRTGQVRLIKAPGIPGRALPPPTDWLSVFDQRHTAALEHTAQRVQRYVADQRQFRARGERLLRRSIQVARIADNVVPSVFVGLGSVGAATSVSAVAVGRPELAAAGLYVTAVAALLADRAADLGSYHLEQLHRLLVQSQDLPGSDSPSDHPAVLRKAGYAPPVGGLTAARHTSTALERIRRGRSAG